jgi:hypothetical protein
MVPGGVDMPEIGVVRPDRIVGYPPSHGGRCGRVPTAMSNTIAALARQAAAFTSWCDQAFCSS